MASGEEALEGLEEGGAVEGLVEVEVVVTRLKNYTYEISVTSLWSLTVPLMRSRISLPIFLY